MSQRPVPPPIVPDVAERRFVLLTGLRWLPVGVSLPVMVLLMQARGLPVSTVGALLALYSVVTIALELPTGGLADVLGRQPVLAAASVTSAAGLLTVALASSVALLAAGVSLLAAGRALSSGPLEAWFVDTVRSRDPQADLGRGLARGNAAESISLGVGAAVGGALPLLATTVAPGLPTGGSHPLLALSVPMLVAAALMAGHGLLVVLLVREPPTARDESSPGVGRTVTTGARQSMQRPVLRRLMLASGAVGVVLATMELLSPGTFADLLGGTETGSAGYGVLVGLGFAATAGGALASARLGRGRGGPAVVVAATFLATAPAALLVGSGMLPTAVAGYLAVYALLGVGGPLMSQMLHEEVGRAERSTTLSVQSLVLQAGGAAASLTVGGLAVSLGEVAGYAVAAVACLVGAGLLWRSRRVSGAGSRGRVRT